MPSYSHFPEQHEMLSEFETAMSDYRCQFHCSDKYKSILMEIFWHDFSEQSYPKKWLLSFREDLQNDFCWPWLEECRQRFRKEGITPDGWENSGLTLVGDIIVQFQLVALSRTITSVSYSRKKHSDLVRFLTDQNWRDIFIPSGPNVSLLSKKIADEKNPTLKYDILNNGYLSSPPYYPYDGCHISLKKEKRKPFEAP